jgi:hypothetical protein
MIITREQVLQITFLESNLATPGKIFSQVSSFAKIVEDYFVEQYNQCLLNNSQQERCLPKSL